MGRIIKNMYAMKRILFLFKTASTAFHSHTVLNFTSSDSFKKNKCFKLTFVTRLKKHIKAHQFVLFLKKY